MKQNVNSNGEPGLTAKAIRLLRRIEEYILAEPKRLNMTAWGTIYSQQARKEKKEVPACGTVGCIAGWAYYLKRPKEWKRLLNEVEEEQNWEDGTLLVGASAEDAALEELGLTRQQGDRLFLFSEWNGGMSGWPEKFANQYEEAKTARGRARATVRRIEHFIKTNGAE